MFRGDLPTVKDSRGTYFILVPVSSYILNFLRSSELTLPCGFKETALLRKEAHLYQIEPLIQCLGDPSPLLPYPTNTYEEVAELSSTRKLSKYSNPVAVIITQLTSTLISFTNWAKHMMDSRDFQVSFTFGPCDYQQEVSLRVNLDQKSIQSNPITAHWTL
uniref:Potassium channel tetramerization domain containing 6 n=1 Tax=Xiphophorus maculatus TaxID=8083 RepID=A0A3B5R6R0_XIPMA